MKKVKEIAAQVRKGVEYFAQEFNDEINGNKDSLDCYCAIASHALHTAFEKHGIKSKIIIGHYDYQGNGFLEDEEDINHCWVEIPFYYVDITATQFSEFHNTKVLIFDNADSESQGFYPLKKFKGLTAMKKEWSVQAPRRDYTKKILEYAFDNNY